MNAPSTRPAPTLVAHRGMMRDYPENTLLGFDAAIAAGATHLEFDVQFSRDGVPMVIHDDTLDRTTAEAGNVLEHDADALAAISAHVPMRFGQRFEGECIPRLADAVERLNASPELTVFVEIKRQSLMRFGVEECVDAIEQVMQAARFDWVLISFIQDAVEYARRHHHRPIGWILREYNLTARRIAEIMRPEFLFCNRERLNHPVQLWPGDWQWVIYDVDDAAQMKVLRDAGADLIETGCIRSLLEEQRLRA